MELSAAIRRNDVPSLRAEIAAGAPVNQVSKEHLYESVLQSAAEKPHVSLKTLKALIDAGADPGIGSREVIKRAAQTDDLSKVKYFASLGCPLLGPDRNGYTILHHAIGSNRSGAYEIAEYALDAGVDPDQCSIYGEYPIARCLQSNYFEVARLFLERGAMKAVSEWTPIFGAVVNRDLDAIRALRAQVNDQFVSIGVWTPLQLALRMGDIEMTGALAALGADRAFRDHAGDDLFSHAVEGGFVSTMAWAFENVCEGVVPKKRYEALHYSAARANSLEAARWLVGHGVRPRKKPDSWDAAIYECQSIEMLDFYLDQGVHIDSIGGEGTPLMIAARGGLAETVRHLIARGDDLEATTTGATALHSAVRADSDEVVDILISAGAKLDVEDVDRDTPLCLSRSLSVAGRLIKAGADPDYEHPYYGTIREYLLSGDVAFGRILSSEGSGPSQTESSDPSLPEGSTSGRRAGSLMEIWAAVTRNDIEGIRSELTLGALVNANFEDSDRPTILKAAARRTDVSLETLKFLVEAGADPSVGPDELIRSAAETGDLQRVKYFESLGCPIRVENRHGYTILHSAILSSPTPPYELVDYVLDTGVEPDGSTTWHETPIGYCLTRNFFELARRLLDRGAMESNQEWPQIFSAILRQDHEAVRTHPAEVNAEFFSYGTWTPLQVAIRMGDTRIAQLLIEMGADTKRRTLWLSDPFDEAVATGVVATVEWAFNNICKGAIKKRQRESLHYLASAWDSIAVAQWGIDHGVKPSPTAILGCGSPEMAEFYLQRGAEINAVTIYGTALMRAAANGDFDLVRYLVEKGADIEARPTGETAIHLAVKRDSDEIVDFLLGAGAKLDVLDMNGDPPLCLANSLSVAKKLIGAGADLEQEHWVHGTVRRYLREKDVAFTRIL